jgi:poly-beta-1,6-N-acetyl-D-glucosamine synthase
MLILGLCIVTVTASYCTLLLHFGRGWKRSVNPLDNSAMASVTVIVAARNESSHIVNCLTDLIGQNYPKALMQIVVVDDGSEDDTASLANDLAMGHPNVSVIGLTEGMGKKRALQYAIDNTTSDLIATVDADCRVPPTWLSTMTACQQMTSAPMVLGPVVLAPVLNVFEQIQALEFLAIMGITGGAALNGNPVMANGANLLFKRSLFQLVGGYSGSDNPSGDDVFLMLKMKEHGQVTFVKDSRAIVETAPQATLSDFWAQRKRWVSKKSGYDDFQVKAVALVTYMTNLGCLVALVVLCAWPDFGGSYLFVAALIMKFMADLFFIRMVRNDLQPQLSLWAVLPAQLFILSYVSFIGIFGNVRSYRWKGRDIKVNE